MKNLLISFALILALSTSALAQSSGKAELFLNNGDVAKAKEAIELAIEKEKEKNKPKAANWEVRAKVFLAILESKDPEVQKLSDNPAKEIMASMERCKEIDGEDGRTYTGLITSIPGVPSVKDRAFTALFNKGIEVQDEPEEALKVFEQIAEYFPENIDAIKNAGYFALRAEQYDKAISLYKKAIADEKVFEEYLKMRNENKQEGEEDMDGSDVYVSIVSAYDMKARETDNEEEKKKILKEQFDFINEVAVPKYPSEMAFVSRKINYYIQTDQTESAIKELEQGAKLDPKNDVFLWNLGILHQEAGNEDKAKESFKKALEVNPECFQAAFGLGSIPYNKGAKLLNDVSLSDYNDKESAAMKKIFGLFKEAIPQMEKAHQMNDKDEQIIRILARMYKELGMKDKEKAMMEKLG